MAAGKYDITIEQGATYDLKISYKDNNGSVIDLSSGYSVRMKIRESVGGTIIASTESAESPKNIITSALAASGNNIIMGITAVNTATLDFDNAVYDLELAGGTTVDRFMQGRVALDREITV